MSKVSIIVPVYNLEQFIRQCVDSLLAQTLSDIEIILVDDGSTDSSSSICDAYAEKDERVKVIHQANTGLSGARNNGIKLCSSKWIMIVDGDDWLELNAAEVLYNKAEEYESDILIASYYTNTEKDERKDSFFLVNEFHFTTKEEMLKLQENCISCNEIGNKRAASNMGVTWARLYKKEFIVSNNLEFEIGLKRTQDAIFHLYALERAQRVDYIDVPIHHYRIWKSSASKKFSKDFHVTALEIIEHIKKFMNYYQKENVFKKAYYSKVTKLLLEVVKLELARRSNRSTYMEKIAFLKKMAETEPYAMAIKNVEYSTLTKGQQLGCKLLKWHMYEVLLVLYMVKENR